MSLYIVYVHSDRSNTEVDQHVSATYRLDPQASMQHIDEMIGEIDQKLNGLEHVLIVGMLTTSHCDKLDRLLKNRPTWSFLSLIASSTRMKNLRSGFSVCPNDIHVISSLILLTQNLYRHVLILADDTHGVDLYNSYRSSMTSQNVQLHVLNDRAPSLDKISVFLNSPDTYVINTLTGSRRAEVLEAVTHDRVICTNMFIETSPDIRRHLRLIPSSPFPERFGLCGLDAMISDMNIFLSRLNKIRESWTPSRDSLIGLWNQFVLDMKSSLYFFRNCVVSESLNVPMAFGAHLVSNKNLIDNIDYNLFNERNCEAFNQTIISIYVRNKSRTQIDYWNNLIISPTIFENIYNRDTEELSYQRFKSSITKIADDTVIIPRLSSWPVVVELSEGDVDSVTLFDRDHRAFSDNIFEMVPSIEQIYQESNESEDDIDIFSDADFDSNDMIELLEDDYEKPNMNFYHSVIE